MAPDKEFEDKDTLFSKIRSPNEVGILPLMELEERFKVSRFSRSVRELGIFPRSLLLEKSMWGLEGGEGFEGSEGKGDVIGAVGEAEGNEVAVLCRGLMVMERHVLGGYGR
ncbi:phytosulfokine receptor 1-like [Pyrus ussuriensis x Pyrus communis]|uniref:Phytosulfokine receptor 1-like n=1 Tax=Pyrus ussuriensis x Pyrus communis TaxID=2448454 RepID=A0A5N5HD06_9ROSA|nr:phytosulfokine receptor 1-like [Pyrus ussuriensis x Pyrus communis]